jgi:hypothetical protein
MTVFLVAAAVLVLGVIVNFNTTKVSAKSTYTIINDTPMPIADVWIFIFIEGAEEKAARQQRIDLLEPGAKIEVPAEEKKTNKISIGTGEKCKSKPFSTIKVEEVYISSVKYKDSTCESATFDYVPAK